MQKVLFIRLSAIGDIVMTSLALRCFRNTYPEVKINFLTKEVYADLVGKHLGVDKVIVLKESLRATAQMIVQNEYDYVMDLHANLRTRWLQQLLPQEIKILRYNKHSVKRQVSVWLKRDWYSDLPVPEQYLATLSGLDVENDGQGLSFFIPKEEWISKIELPLTHRFGYIVLSLGAKHFTKRMPEEKWGEICSKLDYPIVLIGGEEDIPLAEKLAQLDVIKIVNKVGVYTLGQSASIMNQAKFVVVQDTGMMHIAAALKVKTVSVWGGTVPYLGFRPYGLTAEQLLIIENSNLDCRPCSKYGRADCPKGHFKCMKDIDVDAMMRRIKKVFEK